MAARNQARVESPATKPAKLAGKPGEDEVTGILDAIARTSTRSLQSLKSALAPHSLQRAANLLKVAGNICAVGVDDAFPVAALLANGLRERGRECELFAPRAGDANQDFPVLGANDLLVLIHDAAGKLPAAMLADARARRVPILAITELTLAPAPGCRDVHLPVPTAKVLGVTALAGHMAVAQSLLIALDLMCAETD